MEAPIVTDGFAKERPNANAIEFTGLHLKKNMQELREGVDTSFVETGKRSEKEAEESQIKV